MEQGKRAARKRREYRRLGLPPPDRLKRQMASKRAWLERMRDDAFEQFNEKRKRKMESAAAAKTQKNDEKMADDEKTDVKHEESDDDYDDEPASSDKTEANMWDDREYDGEF